MLYPYRSLLLLLLYVSRVCDIIYLIQFHKKLATCTGGGVGLI
jgi:hypothetical protein